MRTRKMIQWIACALLVLPAIAATFAPARAEESPEPGYVQVSERANFDGTRWVVYHRSAAGATPPDVRAFADALAEAGVHAYANQVERNPSACANVANPGPNWGFESRDPDCVLEVYILSDPEGGSGGLDQHDYLDCPACVHAGYDVDIKVQPWVREQFVATGNHVDAAAEQAGFLRVLMGHENFHNLQYVVSAWAPYWKPYIEGQASFQETIVAAPASADPTSSWYARANLYQQTALSGICDYGGYLRTASGNVPRSYDVGLYWGYLYWKDGGIGTIERVLEEVAGEPDPCRVGLPAAITAALAARPGLHDTHEAALSDFAVHAYTREFTWGSPDGQNVTDWGEHLDAPAMDAQGAGSKAWSVGPSGLHYVKLVSAQPVTVDCVAGSGWTFRLLLNPLQGPVTTQDVTCGVPVGVNPLAYEEVVFSAVRTATSIGSYTLAVA